MKKFFRSIFKGTIAEATADETAADSAIGASAHNSALPQNSSVAKVEVVIADLQQFVSSSVPDPMTPDEVDPMLHLYDAGYVTSITAADLLAHIESRYQLDLSETQLIGRLQNIEALARHIVESNSSQDL